jgi:AbrB family looped-hinge helix DNA binding protein
LAALFLASALCAPSRGKFDPLAANPCRNPQRVVCESRHAEHRDHARQVGTGPVRRYLTYVKATVSSKGQIVLPAELRRMDGIQPGEEFDVERLDRGDYRLRRRAAPPNEGVVDWLLACPYKGYFVAVESESTDTL